MSRKKWTAVILVLSILTLALLTLQYQKSSTWFVEHPLPLTKAHRFFDIGIVDANGDNLLDIYTSNHHFRQALLIADGQGDYHDVMSEWGLDQSWEFPLAELSFTAPEVDEPGLYIYWIGTQFVVQAHKIGNIGEWQGSLQVHNPIEIKKNDGFTLAHEQKTVSILENRAIEETAIKFSSNTDAYLRMSPGGQGLPITFHLSGAIQPTQIYVGRGKVSPRSMSFSLAMKDRHAMAWADYNNDGQLDIFINRGALGGMLRAYPADIKRKIKDELLISQGEGQQYKDVISEVGINKKDCSGRHARWLDFNNDGLLDLYANCHDRHHTFGEFPKQLYIQQRDGSFRDMAEETGVGMPDQQIGSFAWIDVDGDGDPDLVTLQNEGVFLYRNHAGRFSEEVVFKRPLSGAVQIGNTTEGVWVYDGKITVNDYDADGDLDLFSASKLGNILLTNSEGSYTPVDPTSVGLPAKSFNASWVDYDNDGLPDLHTVPQGLFRQQKNHKFESTNLLALTNEKYQAAVFNWFDLDNDGRQDLLLALNENPSFDRWWDFSEKSRLRTTWVVKAYRNVGASNHWLQIKLAGREGNRQAIGAQVTVVTPDGQQTQEVGSTDGAFFSQGHYRLYFGLGNNAKADAIKIRWSDGYQQELKDVNGDSLLVVERKAQSQT